MKEQFHNALGSLDIINGQALFPVDGGQNKTATFRFVDVSNSSKYEFTPGNQT